MIQHTNFLYLSHSYVQMLLTNAHAVVKSEARGLTFGLSLHLHPYFVYVSSKCTFEPSLLTDAISTKISCTGPSNYKFRHVSLVFMLKVPINNFSVMLGHFPAFLD